MVGGRGVAGRSMYGFGSDTRFLGRFAWYQVNSGLTQHAGRGRLPGLRGLWDMHGGQFEWVHDIRGDLNLDDQIDPTGVVSHPISLRVNRGGGWYDSAKNCRCAHRNWSQSNTQYNLFGFRIAVFPEL